MGSRERMEGETGASVICSGGAQASTSHLRQFLRISFLRIRCVIQFVLHFDISTWDQKKRRRSTDSK